jgi:hypothetical protein
MSTRTFLFAPVLLFGCALTPGAKPHDMSAARHEAVAEQQEATAARHAKENEAFRQAERVPCPPVAPRDVVAPCWTPNAGPEHASEAVKLRRTAAEHRAASRALRDAEARACAGLSSADRDVSPFAHTEDIASVALLSEPVRTGKATTQRTTGVVVTFRAVPGLTAEWLQREVDCHLARNAALGHELPEMDYCPLVPRGASARVTSTGNGFAVSVRGADARAVEEIRERAERLKARGAAPRPPP